MDALELLHEFYKGQGDEAKEEVVGFKPTQDNDMICDCDGDGECCGN